MIAQMMKSMLFQSVQRLTAGETQETEAAGHTAQSQLRSTDIFQVIKFGDRHPCVLV